MKTISIVIPTYNEEDNIISVYKRTVSVFETKLPKYKFNIIFVDNCSTDKTKELILSLAQKDTRVKAIFYVKNFGINRSIFYGLTQAQGDCAILMYADMQDPPEVIPKFVEEWELGSKIVCGVKLKSQENPIMFFVRKCYYSVLKHITEVDHIEQYNGFGLYDRQFLNLLVSLDDSMPYLRGIVAELGFKRKNISYIQEKREFGKSKFNFFRLYDVAMLGITSYSKIVLRMATIIGLIIALCSLGVAAFTFIYKLIHWDSFPVGNAAISIGVFFLGSVQLFFIGLLGEYVLSINTRVLHRPLVIEEERINFDVQHTASDSLPSSESKS